MPPSESLFWQVLLSKLVMLYMDQKGSLSANRRKQYQHKVPADLFDVLEHAYRDMMDLESDSKGVVAD